MTDEAREAVRAERARLRDEVNNLLKPVDNESSPFEKGLARAYSIVLTLIRENQ